MNWEAIGAVGEIVGALAVVGTLAYLATQIKYARLAASDASRQNRAQGVLDLESIYLNNSEFRSAWDKAEGVEADEIAADIAGRLNLTTEEARLVIRGAGSWAWLHWAQFRSIKTEKDELELENIIRAFYSSLPMSVVWRHHPWFTQRFEAEFVAWVNSILSSSSISQDSAGGA